MTVAQLVAILMALPPDTIVKKVVPQYWEGNDELHDLDFEPPKMEDGVFVI